MQAGMGGSGGESETRDISRGKVKTTLWVLFSTRVGKSEYFRFETRSLINQRKTQTAGIFKAFFVCSFVNILLC